jgi:hypothetical protein
MYDLFAFSSLVPKLHFGTQLFVKLCIASYTGPDTPSSPSAWSVVLSVPIWTVGMREIGWKYSP